MAGIPANPIDMPPAFFRKLRREFELVLVNAILI